jgi:hypothetical protein
MNPIPPQYRDWERNDYDHPSQAVTSPKPEAGKAAA